MMMYVIIVMAGYLMWIFNIKKSRECLTEPVKGTDENKAKRDKIIKSINELRSKLTERGDTLKPFTEDQSLDFLNAYKNKLQQQLNNAPTAALASPTAASTNEKKCQKLASKNTWRQFDFRNRLPKNNKCPSGWEATGCGSGMGEFSNKQCRRRKTRVRSELIKSIDASKEELIRRGVKGIESGDGTNRKMIKNRNRLKDRAAALQKELNSLVMSPAELRKQLAAPRSEFTFGTPDPSPLPASANTESTQAPATSVTVPEEDDSIYASRYVKYLETTPCFLGYYVNNREIQLKECTSKDLRGIDVTKVLVQNGTAVVRVLDELFSADGSGASTKDVVVKGTPGKPGKFFKPSGRPILEIVSFTGN